MAVAEKTKSKKQSARRMRRGQMPVKRSINFAAQAEKQLHIAFAIPAIIMILIAAAAFSKFLVVDRLNEVSAAQAEVARIQAKLDAGYEELSGFDDLSELYAHYTYSGFTNEELGRTDRVDVLNLIRNKVIPWSVVSSWTLSGNQLIINMSAESLQQINLIVQQLESDDLVNFCTVNTANTDDNTRGKTQAVEFSIVQARVSVYLNSVSGVSAE